jgi:C4-dicarboxylate-specific signal transduction histidine kinase
MAKNDGMSSVKHRLEVMRGAMPTTRAITIFDASGTLIARSPDTFTGQNFSYREYFQLAQQGKTR